MTRRPTVGGNRMRNGRWVWHAPIQAWRGTPPAPRARAPRSLPGFGCRGGGEGDPPGVLVLEFAPSAAATTAVATPMPAAASSPAGCSSVSATGLDSGQLHPRRVHTMCTRMPNDDNWTKTRSSSNRSASPRRCGYEPGHVPARDGSKEQRTVPDRSRRDLQHLTGIAHTCVHREVKPPSTARRPNLLTAEWTRASMEA